MPRNTRERIVDAALELFNDEGEPHVTTNRIADELGISPGNLHYHFRTKADLIGELFGRFERRMLELLATPDERIPHIEDIWLFLHLAFEAIVDYRFFYRDLNELCGRYRGIHQRFQGILKLSMETARALCSGLEQAGQMRADEREIDALVRNIGLVSTHWIAYDLVLERDGQPHPDRAVWQVMSLVSPYLVGDARIELESLAQAYRE